MTPKNFAAKVTAAFLLLFGLGASLSIAVGSILSGCLVLATILLLIFSPPARRHLPPRTILLPLAALLLTHLIATALSSPAPMRWNKFGEELWLELLLVAVPVLAAGRLRLVRGAVYSLLLGGVIAGLYAAFQFVTGQDPVRQRTLHQTVGYFIACGFTSHHLSYGGQAVLALSVAMAWLQHTLVQARARLLHPGLALPLLACLVLGLGLVFSFARSAQLGAVAAAVYLMACLPRRWRLAGLGALVLLALLALALPPVHQRVAEGFHDEKEVTRVNLWRSSLAGIMDRPLPGWGPGNFDAMLDQHEVPGFYEARSHSHNDLLMVTVVAGVPGLLAFLWLLGATLVHLHLGWRRLNSGNAPPEARAAAWIPLAAAACQVAITVAGVFQVYQTDDEPEMLLYFLVGCGLAVAGSVMNDAPGDSPRKVSSS